MVMFALHAAPSLGFPLPSSPDHWSLVITASAVDDTRASFGRACPTWGAVMVMETVSIPAFSADTATVSRGSATHNVSSRDNILFCIFLIEAPLVPVSCL